MPWARLMPTGGVTPDQDNLKAWFDAGVVCVGIGSKLFTPDLVADPERLTEKIREVRGMVGGRYEV